MISSRNKNYFVFAGVNQGSYLFDLRKSDTPIFDNFKTEKKLKSKYLIK